MAVVVAVRPGQRNHAALVAAGMLAASLGEPVVAVAVVVVAAGVPSPLREGMTDPDYFRLIAAGAFDEAREVLGERLAETDARGARSARAGVLEAVAQVEASHLVISSSAAGSPGRTHPGRTAAALLHEAPVPVTLAPVGYVGAWSAGDGDGGPPVAAPITRATAAFGDDESSREALEAAARLAERADAMLRAVSFFVRDDAGGPLAPSTHGYATQLADGWHEQFAASARDALRALPALGLPSRFAAAEIGDGATWRAAIDALEWQAGELLVVGAGPRGRRARTFLGSRAAEILREAPVPVMVLP